MNITKNIFLIFLGVALATIGSWFYTVYIAPKEPVCEQVQGSLIIWNKADQPVELAIKPKHQTTQLLEIAPGSRGCVVIGPRYAHSKEIDQLKYITIYYAGKKYKFSNQELLNTLTTKDKSSPVFYFTVTTIDESSELWEPFKARVLKDGTTLQTHHRYLVLSNYTKLEPFWSEAAIIRVMKIKGTNQ
jgi:hypothetical protein